MKKIRKDNRQAHIRENIKDLRGLVFVLCPGGDEEKIPLTNIWRIQK